MTVLTRHPEASGTDGRTYQTTVQSDWVDYNDHLRDAFYFLIFSYATDALMDAIGLDEHGRTATGNTLYTLEAHINYLAEAKRDDAVEVRTGLVERDHKRLHLLHSLYREGTGQLLAVSEQLLMNIDIAYGRSCAFEQGVNARIDSFFSEQTEITNAAYCGRKIGIRKP